MKRRQVIEGITATGLLSVGAGVVAGRSGPSSFEDVEELIVRRDGATVERVRDPTTADLERLQAGLAPDEELVSGDDDCVRKCCNIGNPCLCQCRCDGDGDCIY